MKKNLFRTFRHVPVLLLVMIGIAAAGPQKPATLSPSEEDMAKKTGFDRQVFLMVRDLVGEEHIHRLTGYNEEGYQIMADGICASVPEENTERMLSLLRRKLRPLKHMAFVVETNEGIKTDKIGVLKKGTDQYEILGLMQTNGNSYDITNDDIIEKLKEWEKCYPFEIIGANYEWVELEFKTLPRDLKAFAGEVGEFCPDAIDGGATGTDEFVRDLKKTKKLLLWWEP
ncbi:MAG: DUF4253 domain-containing protein [Nitrospirota bacterium]